jgi:8-oxo-dGTP pyrophosphatase MutT (NUDIX family)
VAIKEVKEESGLDVKPVSEDIYSVEILCVDGHIKNGQYVSSHLHFNVTYLLEGDDKLPIRNKPDENKAVAWFDREEAIEKSREEWFKKNIYRKLNDQLKGA